MVGVQSLFDGSAKVLGGHRPHRSTGALLQLVDEVEPDSLTAGDLVGVTSGVDRCKVSLSLASSNCPPVVVAAETR